MTITVLDSYTATRAILTAPLAERPELLRRMLEPTADMYRYFPGTPDLVQLHHMSGGFRADRAVDGALAGLEELHDAQAWDRIEAAMNAALSVQLTATPDIRVPDITVMIVLGDHTDAHFIDVGLGMSGNGGISGYIWLAFWPSPENLARLEAVAVHELNHNLRYSNVRWDPETVTVGEHVVSEGLADAFARHLYGDLGYTRIGVPSLTDDAVYDKVIGGLGVRGMQNFAAYVHGDAIAARYGGTPVGLPTGAGYAVGNRLVDAYLARTGQQSPDALLVDAADVIELATKGR
ncbi:DUF2268 domain-containing protein [Nocardia sp. NPDC050175]|uniref:DUF2268 domain-containing protein n=1 Tax=Nocardia sp. NPDC050175 TaxID=3364317 RepID=UPI0037B2031C